MGIFVERTCTVVEDGTDGTREAESRPFAEFRDCSAYVLLGAPGAGKTAAFKHEAEEPARCDARDFITLDHKRWSGIPTLFIDGLDEIRAGTIDGRSPLDAMRGQLDKLGQPRFRLSCREADWFRAADRRRLETVSPNGAVKVLRLDPLSEDNTRDILDDEGVEDIDRFIDEARDRGLGALLSNPQTLKLLAAAVDEGNWPATRTVTFEAACRMLIRDPNEEHRQAVLQRADAKMLRAAEHLCAVQLLSGQVGYRLPIRTDHIDGYIDLRDIREPRQETLLAALRTKVFDVTDGLATPIHRHIAEFLAGRYLSTLIEDGLPVRRVLALLVGDDGRTVSSMRGLAAWLAAHCHAARVELLERDPLGNLLYGDTKGFSVVEKRHLLACLQQEIERKPEVLVAIHDTDYRWDDVVTPDMEASFREILTAKKKSDGNQAVALAILQSMTRETVHPGLTPVLLDIVRDSECWPAVREKAIEAYVRHDHDQRDTVADALKEILADMQERSVSHAHDDLVGRLLRELYPRALRPAEIGRYLRERENVTFGGPYRQFWEHDVVERSTDEELAGVLDSLGETVEDKVWSDAEDETSSYWSRTIPAKLLAAYLRRSPTIVDPERFVGWLGLVTIDANAVERPTFSTWFSNNPESYKAVVLSAFRRYAHSPRRILQIYSRLPTEVEPSDFGKWCLAQAKTETGKEAVNDFLISRVIARQDYEGLSDEKIEERLVHDPSLLAKYRTLRKPRESHAQETVALAERFEQRRAEESAAASKRQKEWHDVVEANEATLRENRGAPMLLHRLACLYGDSMFPVHSERGRLRLRSLLGSDELVDTVIQAFRASPMRVDLPDEAVIFQLADEKQYHLLMVPFLVGLDESAELYPGVPPLDEQGMRRALAFRFAAPNFWSHEPRWYRPILTSRPGLVADVLVRSIRAGLRRGETSPLGPYDLAYDEDHRPVAKLAVVPLLESFPVRCRLEQLTVLKPLLHAGLQYVARDRLQIIESKLALRSMDAAQRVYWICAGLLVAPTLFAGRIRQSLTDRGHERRARRMAEFLHGCNGPLFEALDVSTLELLVESFGGSCRPYYRPGDGSHVFEAITSFDDGVYTPFLVDVLIKAMASKPSYDATDALVRLSENQALKPWHLRLQDATSGQREVCREANFRHLTVEQVLETLDNHVRPTPPTSLP